MHWPPGFGGLERPENDPVDHFQRKAGRQALEKPANKHFANSSRFALLAAFPTVNLRFQLTRRKRPMDRTGEKKNAGIVASRANVSHFA